MHGLNELGLDLLMNQKKASVDGGSQVSSAPPSIRSVRMSAFQKTSPPAQDDPDNETGSMDYEDLDSASELLVPPSRTRPGFQFQSAFDGFRARPAEEDRPHDDLLDKKREILYQLDRLEKRGVKLPRKFTMASALEDMQTEYERVKRDRELDASIKFQKRMLMASVTGVEFLNHRFDPFEIKLDGWSESMHENLGDYDEVMEELADKYRGRAKIAPEVKMLMMVSGSAFMFHLQQRYFKSMPGLDQVFQQNPDLMRQFATATMNTMNKTPERPDSVATDFASMMGNVFADPKAQQHMRGPSGVDDLLRDLQKGDPSVQVQSMADSDSDASLEGLLRATEGL